MSLEPNKIYLHDPDGYFKGDYSGDNTVTWSEDRIDDNDYEYIRSPMADNQLDELQAIISGIQSFYGDIDYNRGMRNILSECKKISEILRRL